MSTFSLLTASSPGRSECSAAIQKDGTGTSTARAPTDLDTVRLEKPKVYKAKVARLALRPLHYWMEARTKSLFKGSWELLGEWGIDRTPVRSGSVFYGLYSYSISKSAAAATSTLESNQRLRIVRTVRVIDPCTLRTDHNALLKL